MKSAVGGVNEAILWSVTTKWSEKRFGVNGIKWWNNVLSDTNKFNETQKRQETMNHRDRRN